MQTLGRRVDGLRTGESLPRDSESNDGNQPSRRFEGLLRLRGITKLGICHSHPTYSFPSPPLWKLRRFLWLLVAFPGHLRQDEKDYREMVI